MSSASVRNGESHLAAGHVEQTRIARVHAARLKRERVQGMRIPILLRGTLVALIALFGVGLQSANADSGSITLTIYKVGWIIGSVKEKFVSPLHPNETWLGALTCRGAGKRGSFR